MNRFARITTAAVTALVITTAGTATAFASEVGSHGRGADDAAAVVATSPATAVVDDHGTDVAVPAPASTPAATVVDDRGTDTRKSTSNTSKSALKKSPVKRVSKSKHKARRTGSHRTVEHGPAHR